MDSHVGTQVQVCITQMWEDPTRQLRPLVMTTVSNHPKIQKRHQMFCNIIKLLDMVHMDQEMFWWFSIFFPSPPILVSYITIFFWVRQNKDANYRPLVSKNHHPIICLWSDDSSHTLSSLPLNMCTSKLCDHIQAQNYYKVKTKRSCKSTKASKVKKSPSFIWKVSRKYSNLASNILQPNKFSLHALVTSMSLRSQDKLVGLRYND